MLRTLLFIFVVCSTKAVEESIEYTELLSKELPVEPLALNYLGNVGSKQFFAGDSLETWMNARSICVESGLQFVRIKTEAEHSFAVQQLVAGRGPFWLGARDVGNKSMFRWSDYYAPTNPNDPDTFIGDFLYYYNYVEQGPLALQMNYNVGTAIFGAHSFGQTGKAFCESI